MTQNFSLKEQEIHAQQLQKENFALKLRVYQLEEALMGTGDQAFESEKGLYGFDNYDTAASNDGHSDRHFLAHSPVVNDFHSRDIEERVRRENEELKRELQKERQNVKDKTLEIEQLENLLKSHESRIIQYRKELEESVIENGNLKKEVVDLSSQHQRVNWELEKARRDIDHFKQIDQSSSQTKYLGSSEPPLNINDLGQDQEADFRRSTTRQASNNLRNSSLSNPITDEIVHHHHHIYGQPGSEPDRLRQSQSSSQIPVGNYQFEQGISMLRDQISDMKMQLIDKTSNIRSLQIELDNTKSQLRRLEDQRADFKTSEIGKYEQQISQLREQLHQKTSELNSVKAAWEAQERQFKDEIYQKTLKMEGSSHILEQTSRDLRDSKNEVSRLQQKVEDLGHRLTSEKEKKYSIEKELSASSLEKDEQIVQYKHKLDDLKMEISTLNTRLRETEQTLQAKHSQLEILQKTIETQKETIIQLERQSTQQSSDIHRQHTELRKGFEDQLELFRNTTTDMGQKLVKAESEVALLKQQLEMQSVGLDETISNKSEEISKLRRQISELKEKLTTAEKDVDLWRGRAGENDSKLSELVRQHEQINSRKTKLESQLETAMTDLVQVKHQLSLSNQDVEYKSSLVSKLEDTLKRIQASSDGNTKEAVDAVQRRLNADLNKRMSLLSRIDADLNYLLRDIVKDSESNSEYLSSNDRMSLDRIRSILETHTTEDYDRFSQQVLEKLALIRSIGGKWTQRLESLKFQMDSEYRRLNAKLDRKMSKLDQFETLIRDAIDIQKRLKQNLRDKHSQLIESRSEISNLKHRLSTKDSEHAMLSSSEKSRYFEAQSKIMELERLIKQRDMQINELRMEELTIEPSKRNQVNSSQNMIYSDQ